MKQSNMTTPRTLSECQFMTGYRCADIERKQPVKDSLMAAATLAIFAGIGVMLAWRG